jgi:hypothetical protein
LLKEKVGRVTGAVVDVVVEREGGVVGGKVEAAAEGGVVVVLTTLLIVALSDATGVGLADGTLSEPLDVKANGEEELDPNLNAAEAREAG